MRVDEHHRWDEGVYMFLKEARHARPSSSNGRHYNQRVNVLASNHAAIQILDGEILVTSGHRTRGYGAPRVTLSHGRL